MIITRNPILTGNVILTEIMILAIYSILAVNLILTCIPCVQNLLLDPESGILKLCDFGSAKHLVRGEPNVSYICSRYYR